MKNLNKTQFVALICTTLFSSTNYAQTGDPLFPPITPPTPITTPPPADITILPVAVTLDAETMALDATITNACEAQALALTDRSGKVSKINFDTDKHGNFWDVEVITQDNMTYDVLIDDASGDIISDVENLSINQADLLDNRVVAFNQATSEACDMSTLALASRDGKVAKVNFNTDANGSFWNVKVINTDNKKIDLVLDDSTGDVISDVEEVANTDENESITDAETDSDVNGSDSDTSESDNNTDSNASETDTDNSETADPSPVASIDTKTITAFNSTVTLACEAKTLALAAVSTDASTATLTSASNVTFEQDRHGSYWDVEVISDDNKVYDFVIDDLTGNVTSSSENVSLNQQDSINPRVLSFNVAQSQACDVIASALSLRAGKIAKVDFSSNTDGSVWEVKVINVDNQVFNLVIDDVTGDVISDIEEIIVTGSDTSSDTDSDAGSDTGSDNDSDNDSNSDSDSDSENDSEDDSDGDD